MLAVSFASHSRLATCAGLSARLFALTRTESACPHSSSIAGHALTLTLSTLP